VPPFTMPLLPAPLPVPSQPVNTNANAKPNTASIDGIHFKKLL